MMRITAGHNSQLYITVGAVIMVTDFKTMAVMAIIFKIMMVVKSYVLNALLIL